MIDEETAIKLAKEANVLAGFPDNIALLCNLAVAHAAKDVEPVARVARHMEILREEVMLYCDKHLPVGTALYLHPAHNDTELFNGHTAEHWNKLAVARHREIQELEHKQEQDTTLLRQVYELLEHGVYEFASECDDRADTLLTALRERLGETK